MASIYLRDDGKGRGGRGELSSPLARHRACHLIHCRHPTLINLDPQLLNWLGAIHSLWLRGPACLPTAVGRAALCPPSPSPTRESKSLHLPSSAEAIYLNCDLLPYLARPFLCVCPAAMPVPAELARWKRTFNSPAHIFLFHFFPSTGRCRNPGRVVRPADPAVAIGRPRCLTAARCGSDGEKRAAAAAQSCR